MGFFSSITRAVKNIGRGIIKVAKRTMKPVTKVLKKAWKNPLIKAAIIAGAMYFSAGTLAPMLMAGSGSMLSIGLTSTTLAGAISGGATLAIVSGVGAGVSGENIGKAALKGGLMGAAGGAAAGYFAGGTAVANGASSSSANLVNTAAAQGIDLTAGVNAASGTMAAPSAISGFAAPTSGGLLSQAGNAALNAVKAQPLEFAKMALGAIQGASTPDKIDEMNRQQQIDQQNALANINNNQVPLDANGLPTGRPLVANQVVNPIAPVNLNQQSTVFNAQQY